MHCSFFCKLWAKYILINNNNNKKLNILEKKRKIISVINNYLKNLNYIKHEIKSREKYKESI